MAGRLTIIGGAVMGLITAYHAALASNYAVERYAVLEQLQLRRQAFSGAQLRDRFPQFDADGGWLDVGRVR